MFNDVLLLLDDLVLLRKVCVGSRQAGGHAGVQRADAVAPAWGQLREPQHSCLSGHLRVILLTCTSQKKGRK